MARAIWTGAVSFGLVTVPVKLFAAVNSKSVKFNQLDSADHQRVQMKRVNASTGEEVPFDRIVKGYEISPDRYVVIEKGELESIDPKKTKTIDIDRFVDFSELDPIHFDHPYYLAPAPGGAKPYKLLVEAMRETGKVGIATVVIRSKEQLVALRPIGDVLGMTTMVFPDEVVDPSSLDELEAAGEVETSKKELDIAKQLVDAQTEAFEPDRYRDNYRDQILAMIERKAAGEEIVVQEAAEEDESPVPDLMSALKASLDAVRSRDDASSNGASAKKPAPKKPAAKKPAARKKPAAASKS